MSCNKRKALLGLGIALLTLSTPLLASTVQVLAITKDFASIAKSIGGEHVTVQALIKDSRNLHHIQPKPSMVIKVRNADLLIRLGMSQDGWIDSLLYVAKNQKLAAGNPGYLDASVPIQKLEIPTGNTNRHGADVHIEGNPHYWLDPENGILVARQIKERLSKIDPQNKEVYEQNYQHFSAELRKKITVWKNELQPLQNQQFLSYHSVWSYFFKAFGLKSIGQMEPVPGIPPSTAHLSKIKHRLTQSKAPTTILTANYYPSAAGDALAKHTETRHLILPAHVGYTGIQSYTDLFDHLIKELTSD